VRIKAFLVIAFVLAASVVVVSSAPAGVGLADEPCPDANGPNTNTCPAGTVGVAYAIQFKEAEGSGCGPGKQTFTVDSGTFPPGLTLASSGHVTGTPTQAGSFTFYVKIAEPIGEPNCAGSYGEKQFTIPINPAIPKLVIGPEQPGVPFSTVGAPFSLPMTSNLTDAKSWSIVDGSGSLPPGLQIGTTDGVITGTPTTAGTYPFTVRAVLNSDPHQRSDTKALAIVVRDPLAITVDELFDVSTRMARTELGVRFEAIFSATGGSGTNTWSIAGGSAPPGLELSATGTITGRPTTTGRYGFTVSVADTEGRTATYNAVVSVAARLAISTLVLRPGKVLQPYRQRIATTGGVEPEVRVKQGPIPRGIRFDRTLGVLSGTPLKAGTWRIVFEAVDSLGVKSVRTLVLRVLRAKPARGG
jgi:hypothetical protein